MKDHHDDPKTPDLQMEIDRWEDDGGACVATGPSPEPSAALPPEEN